MMLMEAAALMNGRNESITSPSGQREVWLFECL